MRYLKNPELRKQLLLSLAVLLLAAVCGCFFFPALCMGAAALLLLLQWYAFTCRRYRKLEQLSEDTDRLLHGERELNLGAYREGELSILANELEKLVYRLSEQTRRTQQEKVYLSDSLADISHQLRTPLTSLNLLLARLSGEEDESERRRLIYEAGQLLDRTSWLVEALLKIARIDAGTAVFARERVEAGRLVREALKPFGIPMELRGQSVREDLEEGAGFQGDFAWSVECLGNIIKNCLEQAGEGGHLILRARETGLYTEFVVEDDGPGIDPEDLPHLFERFFKGKRGSSAGVGIGLSLSRMIAGAQNGTIRAENRTEGGARFILRFYKGVV